MNTFIELCLMFFAAVTIYVICMVIAYHVIIRTIDIDCEWDSNWAATEIFARTLFWPLTLTVAMFFIISNKVINPIYNVIDNCWGKFQQAITKKIKADVEKKMDIHE